MSSSLCALYFVNEGGHCIDGAVVRSGSKLCHWEEVEALNVSINLFGDSFFKEFANTLHEHVVGML